MAQDLSNGASIHAIIHKFNRLAENNNIPSVSYHQEQQHNHSSSDVSTNTSTISKYGLGPSEIKHKSKTPNETLAPEREPSTTMHQSFNENRMKHANTLLTNRNKETTKPELNVIRRSTVSTILPADIQNNRSSFKHQSTNDIHLVEFVDSHSQTVDNQYNNDYLSSSTIENYEVSDIKQQTMNTVSCMERRPPPPIPSVLSLPTIQRDLTYRPKRTLQLSHFLLEIGILAVMFIVSMVLVLAIRENQINLRITLQMVYSYVYVVSTVWMAWCTLDIIKFRQQWMKLTGSANDQEEYMDIVERYPQRILYFPNTYTTYGLYMKVGAGLLCMGSLLLNAIQLTKIMEILRISSYERELGFVNYSKSVFLTKAITLIWRFIFHCVQFVFLFRYGNIVINRYHLSAKVGLIHIIVGNFCTWFEAIVIETLEVMQSTPVPLTFNTTQQSMRTAVSCMSSGLTNCLKENSLINPMNSSFLNKSYPDERHTLEFIERIESNISTYFYPCFIEYSLICVTAFCIMLRNIGKTTNQSFSHFGDRHVYVINCSRASRGLVLGGIILIIAISTLIPVYMLNSSSTILITDITEFLLRFASLVVVCLSLNITTKLFYDRKAYVDVFDRSLILVTTVGDFAYSFFGLFASIFIDLYTGHHTRILEILTNSLSILQTFLQSGFILDAFKRRLVTKSEIREKPGRELITALLVINLTIWMYDSLSSKRLPQNSIQMEYYDIRTWSIIQAFTAPLSIFYKFHSSVCLADIWQGVYHDGKAQRAGRTSSDLDHLSKTSNILNSQY